MAIKNISNKPLFFKEFNLFSKFKDNSGNNSEIFELGVIGYPVVEKKYKDFGFPQVSMFAETNKLEFAEKGRVLKYHEMQTSGG